MIKIIVSKGLICADSLCVEKIVLPDKRSEGCGLIMVICWNLPRNSRIVGGGCARSQTGECLTRTQTIEKKDGVTEIRTSYVKYFLAETAGLGDFSIQGGIVSMI